MMPATLDSDRLYLFVFGPGLGECIVLRIPPDDWIVIDSCRIADRAAALHVLSEYEGKLSCVVLTHRHKDHYRKFSQVLAEGEWSVIGCDDLALDDDWSATSENQLANEVEQIVAEIRAQWRRRPSCQWWTWRNTVRQVGQATLTALHPDETFARDNPRAEKNHLSTAILLEWKGLTVLLGADVENPHWQTICEMFPALPQHTAMKIAHHASENGVYDPVLESDRARLWIATPYNLQDGLPKFGVNDGPSRLLRHQPEFYLTGLPMAHDCQMATPCAATLLELRTGTRPRAIPFALPGGLTATMDSCRSDVSCYVVIAIAADGSHEVVSCGPGSVRVMR
jgi:hypothetical protein